MVNKHKKFHFTVELALLECKWHKIYDNLPHKLQPHRIFPILKKSLVKTGEFFKTKFQNCLNFFKEHPTTSFFTKGFVGIFIIGQITYQISGFFDSLNSHIDYHISDFKAAAPKIVKGHIQVNPSELSKGTNILFTLSATLKLSSGQLKDTYLIYSNNDNTNNSLSYPDFHHLKTTSQPFTEVGNYINSLFPYAPVLFHPPLHKIYIKQKIHYTTNKTVFFYKPLYLLTIDKQNNIDIQILVVKSYSEMYSLGKYATFIDTVESFTYPPNYQLLSPSDFLKNDSTSKKYRIKQKEIEEALKQISKISQDFYIK